MKLLIIVILLATGGIVTGIAQLGDGQIFITVTSEGKAKVTQSLFPETFVSTIDVQVISENISNLLAIDEENILLGISQNQELLKIATLGASSVDLKYNADILSYESGVFKLKYNSDVESRVNLPPLSKLVSLNTIPIEITDEEYVLPPGDISLSFSIRPVTSKEFFVPVEDSQYKIEAITAAKIEGFSANSEQIQFIIKDKAIVLTIIPTKIMANPNDASLNGEKVDFTQFHKNSTHSWIRIDPHEKGLVKILDTSEKIEDGGGCLIATATYGTEMAPQVQLLREIRDNQLMNTGSGVSFMTGFNSLYYSFSPHVADLERENPFFKEIVKIGITPLLSSLFVMEYAETDEEILGLGISVILMNIGMYFIFPFAICYQGMRIMRTRGMPQSSLVAIYNCNYRSVLKIGIIGLIALFVLSVSIPSAFAQTDSESESPLRMVLDITYQNIVESITDSEMNQDEINLRLLQVEEEYNEAIDLINGDDIVAAKQDVVQTMGIFELIAEDIAESNPIPSQLTPGFGAGIGSASDTGITQGQGLGVGGVPPGIFNQISASNTFAVSEAITSIDEEVGQYRELAKLNNLEGIDFGEFDESVNLAKTLLANGVVPDAQVKLELANQIKDDLLQQIQDAANENSAAEIEQYMDEQKNLGLTQKDVRELEGILEDITTEDIEETGDNGTPDDVSDDSGNESPGNSGEAPGQNKADSGDESPGNSGEAPGQNKDKDNDENELPPGFDSASDTGKANGQGNGLGIGKVPPGLAKLFGNNEETGLPPGFGAAEDNPSENGFGNGFGNIPPGQAKKFESSIYEVYSPDDYFDDDVEGVVEDRFEDKFDKMYKDSKAKMKKDKLEKEKKDKSSKGNSDSPGKSVICHNNKSTISISNSAVDAHLKHGDEFGACAGFTSGITDGQPGINTGTDGTNFTVDGFSAIATDGKSVPLSQITIDMYSLNGGTDVNGTKGNKQAITVPLDADGVWKIRAYVSGLTDVIRTVNVAAATGNPTVTNTIPDISINENAVDNTVDLNLVFEDTADLDNLTYTITGNVGTAGLVTPSFSGSDLTLSYAAGTSGSATITVTAEDTDGKTIFDEFSVTINSGCTTSLGTGTGTFSSIGTCTVIGNTFSIGNNNDVGANVRIGDNYTAGNNANVGNGAIIGNNVNVGNNDPAVGVIIPNGITL